MGVDFKQIKSLVSPRANLEHSVLFFFDGKQAEQVFRDNVIKLYLKGKFDNTTDRSQIKPSKTYLKLVKVTFDLYLRDDLPELPLGYKLPRESNGSRFFFNPVYKCFSFFMLVPLKF